MTIREKLEEAINQIFVEEQTARGITSGDVPPWEAIKLEQMLDLVAQDINGILAFQEKQEDYLTRVRGF